MVPMRGIFEALGSQVSWDDTTNTAIAVKGDKTVTISIDNKIANMQIFFPVLEKWITISLASSHLMRQRSVDTFR